MSIPISVFIFELFLIFLVWAVMLVMNLWMFQKTKGKGNLFMLIGAGCLALPALLLSLSHFADPGAARFFVLWLPLIGAVFIVLGFYLTAKPVVDAQIEALKKRIQDAKAEKKADAPAADEAKSDDA